MATTQAARGHYDIPETPERALEQIQHERRRKSIIAAALFAVATVTAVGFVYLSFNEVPGPETPANAP